MKSLRQYIDELQKNGCYTYTKKEALETLKISDNAYKKAAQKLMNKKRIVSPKRGFFVIVPLEYHNTGTLPPLWYIDEFMKFIKQPYYVGLLSAAAIYGAAHEQPQEFQVITSKRLRAINIKTARINFYVKKYINNSCITKLKTQNGYISISTPEATAIDLIHYPKASGYLNNILAVLSELKEKIIPKKLGKAAIKNQDVHAIQRLGFIFDYIGAYYLTKEIYTWVKKQNPGKIFLRPGYKNKHVSFDTKWNVIINEELEVEA